MSKKNSSDVIDSLDDSHGNSTTLLRTNEVRNLIPLNSESSLMNMIKILLMQKVSY